MGVDRTSADGAEERTQVQFVDDLGLELEQIIQDRVGKWRGEGKKLDLDYSLICLEVVGEDLPADLDGVKVVVGTRGSVGERMPTEGILGRLAEMISEMAEATDRHDPFELLRSVMLAHNGFVDELTPIAQDRNRRGRLKALIARLRGTDEPQIIGAANRYMRVFHHILETGSIGVPEEPEAESGVEGMESLRREDFGKKK